ncbi:microsomal signal peptidase subunit [Amylostereum chailletii]|nr:microsomal signal peptidase subunit [Amylostereum chailletii]
MTSSLQQMLEGNIDFEGQKLVEWMSQIVLFLLTAISFIAGFVSQSLQVTFALFGLGVLVLVLVVIPPWPVYNRHPVKWLPVLETKKQR